MLNSIGEPSVTQTDDLNTLRSDTKASKGRVVMQLVLMGLVLSVSAFAMNRLIAAKPERTARPVVEQVLPVQAQTVEIATQQPTISLFGEVESSRVVDIRPPASGEVISVNPALAAGNRVNEGDILFSIDPFDLELALAEAEANLAQARAALVEAKAKLAAESEQVSLTKEQYDFAVADLERAQALKSRGTLTAKDVEDRQLVVSQRRQSLLTRENNIQLYEAQITQQEASERRLSLLVESASRSMADAEVRAPFSGVIRSTGVETGRLVGSSDVAVSMYDDTALDVRFTLTDAQYGRIATDSAPLIGRSVDLTWTVGATDYPYTGKITRIGSDVASDRAGVDVYARIELTPDAVALRPGAFVSVKVPDRSYPDAIRLSDQTLFTGDIVYVIKDGKLEARPVTVAAFDGADVILSGGLQTGERVLSTRLSDVEPGLAVSVAGDPPSENASQAQSGRPSPELIAKALEISGLTQEQWDALPREERMPFIAKAREAASAQ